MIEKKRGSYRLHNTPYDRPTGFETFLFIDFDLDLDPPTVSRTNITCQEGSPLLRTQISQRSVFWWFRLSNLISTSRMEKVTGLAPLLFSSWPFFSRFGVSRFRCCFRWYQNITTNSVFPYQFSFHLLL
jgi:hypothetical protein